LAVKSPQTSLLRKEYHLTERQRAVIKRILVTPARGCNLFQEREEQRNTTIIDHGCGRGTVADRISHSDRVELPDAAAVLSLEFEKLGSWFSPSFSLLVLSLVLFGSTRVRLSQAVS
jgi:hypothetical protein